MLTMARCMQWYAADAVFAYLLTYLHTWIRSQPDHTRGAKHGSWANQQKLTPICTHVCLCQLAIRSSCEQQQTLSLSRFFIWGPARVTFADQMLIKSVPARDGLICCWYVVFLKPRQVLQATTPSLCIRPAGLPCGYSWGRPMDVYSLLPEGSSTPVATSGFWYEPTAASTPRFRSQYLTFTPLVPGGSSSSSSRPANAGVGPAGQSLAAAAGSLVLALGAAARSWPAGAAVQDAYSSGASHGGSTYSRSRAVAGAGVAPGASAAATLWQVVVEAPAVLVNQLPVAVELSVVGGKGEVRGLAALVDSRQQLPLYGCEAAYYSKLRLQVPGFHSTDWLSLNAAAGSSSSRDAVAARPGSDPGTNIRHAVSSSAADGAAAAGPGGARHSEAGGAAQSGPAGLVAAGLPDTLQLLEQRQVVLTGLQPHQPPQVLLLRTCRNKVTGCLTVSVSCSLWLFNCLGSQLGIRQAGPTAEARVADMVGPSTPPAAAAAAVVPAGMASSSSSGRGSQVLLVPPYPWMSSGAGLGSSSDLAGQEAAAAGHPQGPPSLAAAWAAAGRQDGPGSSSSRSALQRSRSTPSLLASTAGLEFLAAPTPRHIPVMRVGGSFGGLPPAAPHVAQQHQQQQQQQARPVRGEEARHGGQSGASSSRTTAPVTHAPSPFAAVARATPGATAAGAVAPAGPAQPQQLLQEAEEQLPARRSFSASAAEMQQLQLQLSSPSGSATLAYEAAGMLQRGADQGSSDMDVEQGTSAEAAARPQRSEGSVRTRRHSSGLHMLASGRLPQLLVPPLQLPDSSNNQPAECSTFDLLSPTHQQRLLHQLQLQQAAAITAAAGPSAAQLPASASAQNLLAVGACQTVVMPLMRPDMSGWLPLLAGGDISQLSAAAAAIGGQQTQAAAAAVGHMTPAGTSAVSDAAVQQRVAAAAAAADQLLAALPTERHPAQATPQRHTEQLLQQLVSPPSSLSKFTVSPMDGLFREEGNGRSVGRPGSYGGFSQYSSPTGHAPTGPGLAGLTAAVHHAPLAHQLVSHNPTQPIGMRRPSGSWSGAGFADLAAAAAASTVGAGGREVGSLQGHAPGSIGGAMPGYAASYRTMGIDAASSSVSAGAAATPTMCGWPVHLFDASSSSSSKSGSGTAVAAAASNAAGYIELQLCASPAAAAAALLGKGMQWSLPAKVPLLGRQLTPGPCTIVKLPLHVPGSGAASAAGVPLAGAGLPGSASTAPAAAAGDAAARKRAIARGRATAAAGQHEQGACFVSVHTAAVPGGGGAWAVHLLPTYLLVNTLASEVQLRQYDSEMVLQSVPPGGHCCVLWPNAALPLKLQFRVDEPGWSWSGAASVDAPGEFLVK